MAETGNTTKPGTGKPATGKPATGKPATGLIAGTAWEFRYRVWFISAIFILAFACFLIDPVNAGAALIRLCIGPGVPIRLIEIRLLYAGAAALVIAAAGLRTWAAAYLHSDVVHDLARHDQVLVADGPYRRVRNPLYLGLLLMAAGFSVYASRLGAVVLLGGQLWFVTRLIRGEEALLLGRQGARYQTYLARVPRLIPAARTRVPASANQPRWGQALSGESFMWLFAAVAFAFAWTLRPRVLIVGSLLAWLAGRLTNHWWQRRVAPSKRG